MKTINSLDEIINLSEQGSLYIRWSRGPAMDKRRGYSRDYISGGHHNGLSCQRVNPDYNRNLIAMMLVEYQFLRRKDSKIYGWLFFATENGRDSDNAPTVDANSIVPVGKLSESLVNKLSAYNDAYWLNRRSPSTNPEPKLSEYL